MSSLFHLPSLDLGPGMLALVLLSAGAALAVSVILIVTAFRRAGGAEMTNALWGGGLVLTGAVLAALLIEFSASPGANGDRRAIERQAAELSGRAIAPGSALACLDVVASAVADACEKAVFSAPEAVAAAVDYVDARVSLLAASTALADREPSLRPVVERLRGALEMDRFGVVAHVLTTRGCTGPGCGDLKLLRDPARVLANMTSRAFEARIGAYAPTWPTGGAVTSSVTPAASAPPLIAAVSPSPVIQPAPTTSGTSSGGRLDFPSAASIPPVSIMTPEPTAPPAAEPKPAPAKPPVPPRRQSARDPAPPIPAPATQRTIPQASPRAAPQAPQRAASAPPRPAAVPVPPPVQAAPPAPEPEPPVPDTLRSHGAN